MSPFREGNDRKTRFLPRTDARGSGRRERSGHGANAGGGEWIWGRHAVAAALGNPARAPLGRLMATPEALRALQTEAQGRALLAASGLIPETANSGEIARVLPPGAVHQGLALAAAVLEPPALEDVADPAEGLLVMLDQVTDPQNIGAILRSAAAFGAKGVIVQDRNAPQITGSLAKAAAGAVERTPVVRVVNLARALERLADLGWRSVGLDGDAPTALAEALDAGPTVLVLGSEGAGLRRLVGEHCDILARIAMPGGFESLNVAAAAAVALYEASRLRAHPSQENNVA